MNTPINRNPWSILDEMLDVDSRLFSHLRARASGKFPPVNVFLDDNAIIIDLKLPGKTAKDIELALEPQAVVVADRPAAKVNAETGKSEETAPAWSRRLNLPFRVNADKANAKFTDGILRIELPKADEANVRHIAISEG